MGVFGSWPVSDSCCFEIAQPPRGQVETGRLGEARESPPPQSILTPSLASSRRWLPLWSQAKYRPNETSELGVGSCDGHENQGAVGNGRGRLKMDTGTIISASGPTPGDSLPCLSAGPGRVPKPKGAGICQLSVLAEDDGGLRRGCHGSKPNPAYELFR